ncbi:hypothetical protein [Nonomuraea sp. LPB2021202275-12-8]|uniref:hypothetical protein n=1 Tax=Nonomuraea sp. LPB2021202275-12-8 TaxID=3120159 RepID=UPI00300C1471
MTGVDNPPWRPLNERGNGSAGPRELVKGVPDYLAPTLRQWLFQAVAKDRGSDGPVTKRVGSDLLESLRLRLRNEVIYVDPGSSGLIREWLYQGDDLLVLVDAVLAIKEPLANATDVAVQRERVLWVIHVKELGFRLAEAGSVWQVNRDLSGLEERVDGAVRSSVDAALAAADDDTSTCLRKAWDKAYGLQPDPSEAYSQAVKAVEAATIPVYLPGTPKPTLGTVLRKLENSSSPYTLVVDAGDGTPAPADPVVALMRLLWEGHRDRHPGGTTTKPITLESARAAVQIAVLIVQLVVSGAVLIPSL